MVGFEFEDEIEEDSSRGYSVNNLVRSGGIFIF